MSEQNSKTLDDAQLIQTAKDYLQTEFGANTRDAEITVHHSLGQSAFRPQSKTGKLTDDSTLITATFNGEGGIVTANISLKELRHAVARQYRTADTQVIAVTEPDADKPSNEAFSHFVVKL